MTGRAVAVVLALVTVTAGCSAILGGATTFTAAEVSVSDAATAETGYSLEGERNQTLSRSFAGQDVEVTNRLAEYARSSDVPLFGDTRIARFTVYATPAVEVAGQGPFNPVADLNNTELVLRLQEQYDTIDNVRLESNRTETMLGEGTRVSKFRAEARTVGGQNTDVFLHVTKTRHGSDYVVAVAVYPTQVDGEQARVNALLNGVQHAGSGGDAGSDGGSDTSGGAGETATATQTDDGLV
jgi:hypothetical protein